MVHRFGIIILVCLSLGACRSHSTGLGTGTAAILKGERPGIRFGSALDWVDVNGDGFADLVVGAPQDYRNGEKSGTVSVYLGGAAGLTLTPSVQLLGSAGDEFGLEISNVGDLNEDGFEDVAIVSHEAGQIGNPGSPAVFFYYGSASGLSPNSANVVILKIGAGSNDIHVASAGDVNQDGHLDVVVGDPENHQALIFFGGSLLPTSNRIFFSQADLVLQGRDQSEFGAAVQAVGDVNGEFRGKASRFGDDLVIGAPTEDNVGAAYLVVGQAGLSSGVKAIESVAVQKYVGPAAGSRFGASVAGINDFDGDGVGDFSIGVPSGTPPCVYLFFGQAIVGPSFLTPAIVVAEQSSDQFGYSISGMLSASLSGVYPLLVGAPRNTFGGNEAGTVYLFSRNVFASGSSFKGQSIRASVADSIFRNPVAGLGGAPNAGTVVRAGLDVNGDQIGDLAIGIPGSSEGGIDTGAVEVLW